MNLNFEELKNGKHEPYLHGNGFIQLWLDDNGDNRLHVFPDERLEAQKVDTPIHNHVFGFNSRILCGLLVNHVYSVFHDPDGNWQIYEATPTQGKNTQLTPVENGRAIVKSKFTQYLYPKGIYDMPPFEYHETTWHTLSASIMTKTLIISGFKPRVLCDINQVPDNDFSRHGYDKEVLWKWIEKALKKADSRKIIERK